MIMLKHNQHHQITFTYLFIWLLLFTYNSQTTSNVNDVNVKSPTKTHTDHYNGDLKITASILLIRSNIFSRIHFYSADVMNCWYYIVKSPTKTHTDHYNGDLKITASILLIRFNIFSRIHFYSADVMNCWYYIHL